MYSSFYRLEDSVQRYLADGKFTEALDVIRNFVTSVMHQQASPGEVTGSRKLDELCERIGKDFAASQRIRGALYRAFSPDENEIAIVVTGLYQYGGTSLVVSDIIRAHPGRKVTVLATNFLNDMKEQDLSMSRVGNADCDVFIAPPGSSDMRLEWLLRELLDLKPSRIFLMNHHQDSAIIAAMQPLVDKTKVIFYHHADYNLCLGVHLKGAIHVDPHNVGFYNCRNEGNILDNSYVPLTVDDKQVSRAGATFATGRDLVTCASGTFHKFQNFYLYPYSELIIDRLAVRGGCHLHIGNIPDHDLNVMREKIAGRGLRQERLVHVPWTPDLWSTLVKRKVDLFIGSFPIGGARTTIEAMGAGIPILMPQNYLSRFFSSRDIVYKEALSWQYPKDFSKVIASISGDELRDHSYLSRAHYLREYSPQGVDIEGRFDSICSGRPTPTPYALYPHEPDQLDRVLHFTHVEWLVASNAVSNALNARAHDAQMPAQQRGKARRWFGLSGRRQA